VIAEVSPPATVPAVAADEAQARLAEANAQLAELEADLEAAGHPAGFPAATRLINWKPLERIFSSGLVNHLGTPYEDGLYPRQAKRLEVEAVNRTADLFRAPAGDRWGYVASGGSEAILWGLRLARRRLDGAVVLHSSAAHPAIPDAVETLAMPFVELGTDRYGEMDYADLAEQVRQLRRHPIVVVANAGTTWTEAVDDVRKINAVLDRNFIPARNRLVLVDAALSGFTLATMDPNDRPGFDLADGAQMVVVSTHKYLGTPVPGSFVVTLKSLVSIGPKVGYTGSQHTTLTSSRNGHAAIAGWYALKVLGEDGLAATVRDSRDVASYLKRRLDEIGWRAERRPNAITVTLDAPPEAIRRQHHLQEIAGESHVVCVHGFTRQHADQIIARLTLERRSAAAAEPAAPADPAGAGQNAATNGRRRIFPPRQRAEPDAPLAIEGASR